MTNPTPPPVVHLRVLTEPAPLGGSYLISKCGERLLDNRGNRRRITKSLTGVTCEKCRATKRAGKV